MFCPILDYAHHFSIIHNSLSCSVHLSRGDRTRHLFSPPDQRYKEPVVGNDIHQAGPKIGCEIQVHHYLFYREA